MMNLNFPSLEEMKSTIRSFAEQGVQKFNALDTKLKVVALAALALTAYLLVMPLVGMGISTVTQLLTAPIQVPCFLLAAAVVYFMHQAATSQHHAV